MRGAVATKRADGSSIRAARVPTKISTFYIPLHVDRTHWVGAKIELVRLPIKSKGKTPGLQGLQNFMDSLSTSMRTEYQELYKVVSIARLSFRLHTKLFRSHSHTDSLGWG
jgi:hypothetical protein